MFKYIVYLLGLELGDNVAPLVEYGFNVAMICLAVLLCFINILGYLTAFYLIDYYGSYIDNKYPKVKGILNYFKKSSMMFFIIEVIVGFGGLITLIILGFYPLFR